MISLLKEITGFPSLDFINSVPNPIKGIHFLSHIEVNSSFQSSSDRRVCNTSSLFAGGTPCFSDSFLLSIPFSLNVLNIAFIPSTQSGNKSTVYISSKISYGILQSSSLAGIM